MPSADQVPVKSPHLMMHWHMWVVLIAGSTGSALRAVRPPNLLIAPDVQRDLVSRRKRDGFFVALALGHHGPSHSPAVELQDLRLHPPQLRAERGEACAHNLGYPVVAYIGDDFEQRLACELVAKRADPRAAKWYLRAADYLAGNKAQKGSVTT